MDKNLVVSIHVQSVDQLKAIKLIKGKITDLDRMKIEEQKKAVRSGYDMEIIPSDLATYGGEAKKILDDLQSRNERMFLVTVLFLNWMSPNEKQALLQYRFHNVKNLKIYLCQIYRDSLKTYNNRAMRLLKEECRHEFWASYEPASDNSGGKPEIERWERCYAKSSLQSRPDGFLHIPLIPRASVTLSASIIAIVAFTCCPALVKPFLHRFTCSVQQSDTMSGGSRQAVWRRP